MSLERTPTRSIVKIHWSVALHLPRTPPPPPHPHQNQSPKLRKDQWGGGVKGAGGVEGMVEAGGKYNSPSFLGDRENEDWRRKTASGR